MSGLEKDGAEGGATVFIVSHVWWNFAMLQDFHHDRTATMGASMLSKVVATRKLLATLVAFEWLVVCVERAIMAFEMFLATEAT